MIPDPLFRGAAMPATAAAGCAPLSVAALAEVLLGCVLDGQTPITLECWAAGDGMPVDAAFGGNDIVVASATAAARSGRVEVASYGSGSSANQRCISAILEVAEAVTFYESLPERHASLRALCDTSREVVHPRRCVLPTARGPEWLPFSAGTSVDWASVEGVDGVCRWIHRPTPLGPLGFYRTTTSGLSAGQGWMDAVLRGSLELIERDAVMLHWFGQFGARRIDEPLAAAGLAEFFRARGFSVELFDLSTELGVAVVLALVTYSTGPLALPPGARIAAAGAAFELSRAATKALLEAVQTVEKLALHQSQGVPLADATGAHLRYYLEADRAEAFEPLRSGPLLPIERRRSAASSDRSTALARVAAALQGIGVALSYRDITPDWLLHTPVRIAEVWAPGLQPLDLCLPARRVVSPRLLALGSRCGIEPRAMQRAALSRPPHPLG